MNVSDREKLEGMSFALGDSRAVAVTSDVFAIEGEPKFAFIPGSKPAFQGFFKYASRMVPCFDLQILCGLPPLAGGRNSCLISRTISGDLAGIWVNDVKGVRNVRGGELQVRPEIPSVLAPYVLNSCAIEEMPHLLLDIQKLVTDLTGDAVTLY